MTTLVTIRPNGQLIFLLDKLHDYHRGATRTEIINRALRLGVDKETSWKEAADETIGMVRDLSDQPQFIKFRADSQALEKVEKNIKNEFGLKIVQKPFLVKLALINYLNSIDLDLDDQRFIREIKADVWSVDPDDTIAAKKFYEEFWGEVLDSEIGIYRGDTIISFNRVAGGIIRLLSIYKPGFDIPTSSEERVEIIKNSHELPYSIKEDFIEFQQKYHSLANFMPLLKLQDTDYNLNHVKNRDYRDFPDFFLDDVRKFYLKDKGNQAFYEENNKSYFNSFGASEKGYKNYIEKNYLQDFFLDERYSKVKTLTPPSGIKFPYYDSIAQKLNYDDREKIILYTGAFLKNALDIIKARSVRFKGGV